MTQDTEDAVALTATWPERYYMSLDGDPFAAGFLKIGTEPSEGATEYVRADVAQSLSDRIDVRDRLVRKAIRQLGNKRWEARYRVADALETLRAALHQEGIAPGSDPLRFGVETRVNIARSQDTPDSRGDG